MKIRTFQKWNKNYAVFLNIDNSIKGGKLTLDSWLQHIIVLIVWIFNSVLIKIATLIFSIYKVSIEFA